MTSVVVETPSTPIPRVDPEAELKAMRAEAPSAKPAGPDPRGEETFVFSIRFVERNGNVLEGTFENKILSINQRLEVGLLKARMSRNTPWFALDEDTQYLLEMTAHLTVSLSKRPDWYTAKTVNNVRLVEAIYKEVTAHETYFRGPPALEAGREG